MYAYLDIITLYYCFFFFPVTTCGLAVEALDRLRERKDGFHIVISDVNMPDMDGFKLLELVGLEMDLPVISEFTKKLNIYNKRKKQTDSQFIKKCEFVCFSLFSHRHTYNFLFNNVH